MMNQQKATVLYWETRVAPFTVVRGIKQTVKRYMQY